MSKPDNEQPVRRTSQSEPADPSVQGASHSSVPALIRWFLSKDVRHLTAMRKHVWKLLNHQRDILAPPAIEAVESAMASCQQAVAQGAGKPDMERQMENLEKAANKWLKPYPNAAWRENVEVLLVALAVAMGIRTFFLQPFKIPTGSMQPTLFGVTSENLIDKPDYHVPTGLARVREWFAGASYVHKVASNDGVLDRVGQPVRLLIFNILQTISVGGKPYTILFPPDCGAPPAGTLEGRSGLQVGLSSFTNGQDIVKLRVTSGDHLFVDRFTYNFRPPKRGETIVFETRGIEGLPQDQFYIKRLVALGGEQVQIGDDRHLVIDGKRLDASTPHFENVYSFDPKGSPHDSRYSGHVNFPYLAPYFQGKPEGVFVATNHFMVMGDNTMNSLDSRAWGDFPSTNVIGKSFFVYWPITSRFGWGNR
ncbi:MAG: signal peptidase I [Verrucomicrobia bacterium]|nr:signal peptidase I [Verrucomicrobiota bacterium]